MLNALKFQILLSKKRQTMHKTKRFYTYKTEKETHNERKNKTFVL